MAGGTFYGTRTHLFMTADTLGMKCIRFFRHRFDPNLVLRMAIQASFWKRPILRYDMAGLA